MRRALAALLVLLIGLHPALLQARQSGVAAAQSSTAPVSGAAISSDQVPQTGPAADIPDLESLGVSFARIKRILGDRPPSKNTSPLKLNYYIEVVAMAPAIRLFTPEQLAPTGAIPWSPPRHSDIVAMLTPIEFKSGSVPVSSLAFMGIQKFVEWQANRMKRQKAEEERKKRDEEERRRQQMLQDSGLIVVKPPK